MSDIFQSLMDIGIKLGTVTSAHMYDANFINIDGVTKKGKEFHLSLNIKEENEND